MHTSSGQATRWTYAGLFLTSLATLMHEIPRNDLVTRGVRFQPTLSPPKELLDFVIANPVVLLVVHHRDQDVQMREQLVQRPRRPEHDREDATWTERRHLLVQRMTHGIDVIAERLE